MSVPGVGPITALAFWATIDRPDRFRRLRDVGAHLGLTPARNRIVPVGTVSEAISLRVPNLRAKARKVVKQIEAPRPPKPIMRRPCANREEKRSTRGSDTIRTRAEQKQLDLDDPNQRGSYFSASIALIRSTPFFSAKALRTGS